MRSLVERKYFTLIFVSAFIFIYVIFAVIETMSISYKTPDEAFASYLESTFNTDDFPEEKIQAKEFHRVGDDLFVPYKVDDSLSVVSFENGWFGWKMRSATTYIDEDNLFLNMVIGDKQIIYGLIPENLFTETEVVMVNDSFADTIELDADTGLWLFVNNDFEDHDDTATLNIQFMNAGGE